MAEPSEPIITTKGWLERIDAKQDRLEEKIDRVAEGLERKADARDLQEVQTRLTIIEQSEGARVDLYSRLQGRVDLNTEKIDGKADRSEVSALWRVLMGALGGSAIAILAWALTVFVR